MNPNKQRRQGRPIKVWTPEKCRLLKKLYPKNENDGIVAQLGVTEGALRQKASAMGLKKVDHNWSEPDKEWLIENYHKKSMTALVEKLARTEWAIINQFRELTGLRDD